ncbi:imidazole glycerol phosphate synthase [Ignicoccus pacificus DSM 13166]|uniref:Imidazole glycerol phosphate synthase subunit HisH n=1 Tax=Ignicoccus pacificus DSM 13166 TaxID=940294 RepID=A0A977K920_9CREN|nr:imidazole glycerol phosphate synthase [Ignicoccus pacificus DSM 13166]
MVDYGIGNTFSIRNGLQRVGFRAVLTKDLETLRRADLVVLPGVGSHQAAMSNIERYKLIDYLKDPDGWVLGICLGMQLLYERSEEGGLKGLGLLKGEVIRFRGVRKVPHMGWNEVNASKETPLLEGIEGRNFYFAHSFYKPFEGREEELGITEYEGVKFTSLVQKGKIIGTQFHPEKSSSAGRKFLENLAREIRR